MSECEEIALNGGERDMRRNEGGLTKTSLEESASLSADAQHKSKYDVEPDEGGRGDDHKH